MHLLFKSKRMFENKDIIIEVESQNDFKGTFESIKTSADFEEIQQLDKSRTGNPLKVAYLKSKEIGKQVIMIPVYNKVMKAGKAVGYDLLYFVAYVRGYDTRTKSVFTINHTVEIDDNNVVKQTLLNNV